ncbi:MAG TPA: thermonuclease family protein [Solirubrobacteraceae bacterium]
MSRKLVLVLVALLVAALAAGVRPRAGDKPGAARATRTARVVHVVDGDTIRVLVGGREERVRYIGIDTPESVKEDTPVQCFAKRAATENARLVAGRDVRLVPDVETRDRFGRLLAYVYRTDDGEMVNEALVRGGFARTLTIAPNVRFAERFRQAARAARRSGLGLWSACESR